MEDLYSVAGAATILGLPAMSLGNYIERYQVKPDATLPYGARRTRGLYSLHRLRALLEHNESEMDRRGSRGGLAPAGFSYQPFEG